MNGMNEIERHYAVGNILSAIKDALSALGRSENNLSVDDLSAVDEFHIGGRIASEHLFKQLGIGAGDHILDLGAGIGGGARFAADRYGASVTGIDLTAEYVEAGREMNEWVGISDRVELRVGDAIDLKFPDEFFDGAFTMHVLMNVEDKAKAFSEAYRVLKPGAVFGIYDVMKYGEGDIRFPVPWATDGSASFLATANGYVSELEAAGFTVEAVNDRHEFGVGFFKKVMERLKTAGGPPAFGLHLLMGSNAKEKVENLTANLIEGLVAPFEIIARKP